MKTIRPKTFAVVLAEFAAASDPLRLGSERALQALVDRGERLMLGPEPAKTVHPRGSELVLVDVPGIH
jgi:hypothetical protein